jgi:hypothetical protein
MTEAKSSGPPAGKRPCGRASRRAARDLRDTGSRLVAQAKLHLLAAMRHSERCAPWRSGRTLKDLERRTGLAGPSSPARAPLVAPLLELLVADGVVVRRAGHYRLAAGPPHRCPACGAAEFTRRPAPASPDDVLGDCGHFTCTTCGAWCGPALPAVQPQSDPTGSPPTGKSERRE